MSRLPRGRQADARSRSRGQALVEFALVLPLMLILLVGIVEAGRFVLNLQVLNNATREGARFAIVHGAQSDCPSGPMPGEAANPCGESPLGAHTMAAVRDAAVGLADQGDLDVPTPRWTAALSPTLPDGPDDDDYVHGDNFRGSYVTVYADYSYDPIIKWIFDTDLIPSISMQAESTLVINH